VWNCTEKSRPVRARGLKPQSIQSPLVVLVVAPRAGAWIETARARPKRQPSFCRAPCGRVD